MSEIRKKDSSSGFQASEARFETRGAADLTSGVGQGRNASSPSFDSGVGQTGNAGAPSRDFGATPAEESVMPRPSASEPARSSVRPAPEEPKKRYYSQQEVMKKKGCIGCGGMALAIPLGISILGLAIAIF